jgi:hypothetical protein
MMRHVLQRVHPRDKRRRSPGHWPTIGRPLMSVTLGSYPTMPDLRSALDATGYASAGLPAGLLDQVPISRDRIRLDLFEVTAEELGFSNRVSQASIYRRAKAYGFVRVPAEAALLLRLRHKKQRRGEWLHVGMDPLIANDGKPYIFGVDHCYVGLVLCADSGRDGESWGPASRWVFGRIK